MEHRTRIILATALSPVFPVRLGVTWRLVSFLAYGSAPFFNGGGGVGGKRANESFLPSMAHEATTKLEATTR
jgi:hypothetical protein